MRIEQQSHNRRNKEIVMRAVLIPIAHGYGSTARLIAVAKALRSRGHAAVFAAADYLTEFIGHYGFELRRISAVKIDPESNISPIAQVLQGEASGDFLEQQVSEVRQIIGEFQADVVIFSHNNAAAVAAGAEDLPSVSIFHPTIMQPHDFPTALGLFVKWRKFFALKDKIKPKKEVPSSILGDINFIPSIPSLIYWPFLQPPEVYFRKCPVKTIGALLRTSPDELPSQEELKKEFGAADEPFIYASVGGGIADLPFLEAIAEGLRLTGYNTLMTAGVQASDDRLKALSSDKLKIIRFLPEAVRAIKACDVLVWHGGHETMLEAVAAAKPGIGIPYQHDQYDNVIRFAQMGAGIAIPKHELSPALLASAVETVLKDPSYGQSAQHLKRINDSLGGVTRLVESTEALVSYGRTV